MRQLLSPHPHDRPTIEGALRDPVLDGHLSAAAAAAAAGSVAGSAAPSMDGAAGLRRTPAGRRPSKQHSLAALRWATIRGNLPRIVRQHRTSVRAPCPSDSG